MRRPVAISGVVDDDSREQSACPGASLANTIARARDGTCREEPTGGAPATGEDPSERIGSFDEGEETLPRDEHVGSSADTDDDPS